MIALIQTLPIGNALRVHLRPPDGASRWRLLRKPADAFAGHDDPAAHLVLDSDQETVALDRGGLVNGQTYFYRSFALVGGDWVASPSVGAIPQQELEDRSVDVLSLVRERLEMGLQADIDAGRLRHRFGRVPVLTAPPVFEDTAWPVVVVHLQSDAPSVHGLGMVLDPGLADENGDWTDMEGYLSAVNLTIAGWSLNPDERIALRKALKRVLIGNMPVFDDAGMVNIDTQFSDTEDFQSYSAPVYQAVCQFSCLAPSAVNGLGAVPTITETITTALTP